VALAGLRADALLLGGDFVSLHARHIDTLAPLLGQIPAPLGRYAVLGNHDRWADAARIVRLLEAAGVQVLINRAQRLAAPFAQVAICGLDDADTGAPDAEQALAGADGVRIVLMHSPDGLRNLAQHRFDLALCGHTHGGQIALRSGRPLLLPGGPFCRRYPAGRFELGDAVSPQTLIVSRGVGYSTIPLRVHAPPDILAIRVAASEAGA
jgi:predicted MPP superfamily phosphohydrolase